MLVKTSTIALALATFTASATSETVHGVVVFSRHGDRTSKHYKGYRMTNLGFDQVFASGSSYRQRYISSSATNPILGISSDVWQSKQIFAVAPDQEVLMNTGTAFLQGLYPPVDSQVSAQELNNGTSSQSPLGGYQYVLLHSKNENSPDTIWLKGDDSCPVYTTSSSSYNTTAEFKTIKNQTMDFYQQFDSVLSGIYTNTSKLSYANAYDIFDLINVGLIHNSSLIDKVSSQQLQQLKVLADRSEFNRNYSPDDSNRSIGGQTFINAVLVQLNQTVATNGTLKFSLLTGSYDTFLAFFGLTDLTAVSDNFYGLPDYASSMAFELFTSTNMTTFPTNVDDLRIRYMFRNGSSGALTSYPLFGGSDTDYSYSDFVTKMSSMSISKVSDWCSKCESTEEFCTTSAASDGSASGSSSPATTTSRHHSGMSNVAAGAIGAGVTLGVVLLCLLAFMALRRKLFRKRAPKAFVDKDIEGTSTSGSSHS